MTGGRVPIVVADADKPVGSDGRTVFLPPEVGDLPSTVDGFGFLKLTLLHQLARFQSGNPAAGHSMWRRAAGGHPLAWALAEVLEGQRVDGWMIGHYPGIRATLESALDREATRRAAEPWPTTAAGAAAEYALRRGVDSLLARLAEERREAPTGTAPHAPDRSLRSPSILDASVRCALDDALHSMSKPDATVALGARHVASWSWLQEFDEVTGTSEDREPLFDPVRHRGVARFEAVEDLRALAIETRELDRIDPDGAEARSEKLGWQIVDDSLALLGIQDGDLFAFGNLMQGLDDGGELVGPSSGSDAGGDRPEAPKIGAGDASLETGLEEEIKARLEEIEELARRVETERRASGAELDPARVFYYDEWDYLRKGYRPRWCRLLETRLEPGDSELVDRLRVERGDLLGRVRREFERLRPEAYRRIRRLTDGEDLDLDRVIESHVDRRAGLPPYDDVYTRRQKQNREVAAIFLVDMSASTDSAVAPIDDEGAAGGAAGAHERVDPLEPKENTQQTYSYGGVFDDSDPWEGIWGVPAPSLPAPPKRRVIDIEKESLVLMAEALEALEDDWAVYGFSGYGHDAVDLYVAKELGEPWSSTAERRIAAMEPCQSTRMGPAIRHATARLLRTDARLKVLLVLSDGYPQDHDYGDERGSRTYGVQDTMMALDEAERAGVDTFCITVDPAGHDYLREMCPDQKYLVIDDIAALPGELPKVYRGLTTRS